MIDLFPKASSP